MRSMVGIDCRYLREDEKLGDSDAGERDDRGQADIQMIKRDR